MGTMNFSCWHLFELGKKLPNAYFMIETDGSELEPGLFGAIPRQIPVVL